ncbi:MAG: rRNA methyltransferase [Clostridiales bacterium]|nr:rRNA methyltransferase [Clostridiales bacterium]
MKVQNIYSKNAEFQRYETLKRNREKRSKQALAFLEGVQPVEQAIRHGYEFYSMCVADGKRLSGWAEDMIHKAQPDVLHRMDESLLKELSDRENPCEIIALVKMRFDGLEKMAEKAEKEAAPFFAVFDRPASPGNLGTFLRSADAFKATGAIVTGHAADFYDTQTIRGSVGACFALPFANLESAETATKWLKSLPSRPLIVGTSAKGEKDISEIDLTGPVALVIGNETFGLSKAWKEKCDELVKIPIFGAASSLNAGCAATVCFYEINRQRRQMNEDD